jgi:pimeloyl-ACP methyl ester carboxylesterase
LSTEQYLSSLERPMTISPVTAIAGTFDVPGAQLYYEVRGHGPLMALVGAPMDAVAFAPLADVLATDHTVLTTDPRGIKWSTVERPDQDSTPQMRADDLFRLLTHLDAGPAAVLGSSGGAVSVLALAQAHPEAVHTVVAHEPPLIELLPDRAERHAGNEEVISKWLAGDYPGSWATFLDNAGIRLPEGASEAMFGGEPDPQALADTTYQNTRMLRATAYWMPDIALLRSAATRVVVGIGEDSAGQLCDRASRALATALGTEPELFPGGHAGFVQDPGGFAARLRSVLGER